MARRLVGAGKVANTPGGHKAIYLEFNRKGLNPIDTPTVQILWQEEPDPEEPDTDCHCGHPECGAC